MHKILIVEDERIIASDLNRTLIRLGYRVSGIAPSGDAALECVTADRPDLVLMDIKLKGEPDGIETARRLHEEFKIPVIYLTAYVNDELLSRAKITEPFGYIVKPFEERSLQITIEIAIYKIEAERERQRIYQDAQKALVRSNQELEQFTSIASHDLKSPLTNILSYSEALAEESPPATQEGKNYLKVIHKSALRMEHLINDLLEFAQVSHVPKEFEEIDLKDVVNKVLEDLEVKIHEKKAIVEVGALPRLREEPMQMKHVFQNLIENALKYSCEDGQTPVIQIDGKIVGRFAEIHVRDNGIGFDEKFAEHIFMPFKRLSRKCEGSGIGLAICQKIVKSHGGRITAKSSPNQGSDFIVRLPVLEPAQDWQGDNRRKKAGFEESARISH